jgi:hypothetical protein
MNLEGIRRIVIVVVVVAVDYFWPRAVCGQRLFSDRWQSNNSILTPSVSIQEKNGLSDVSSPSSHGMYAATLTSRVRYVASMSTEYSICLHSLDVPLCIHACVCTVCKEPTKGKLLYYYHGPAGFLYCCFAAYIRNLSYRFEVYCYGRLMTIWPKEIILLP